MEKVNRKWGCYLTLLRLPWFCIKILKFKPHHAISKQKHFYRSEWWLILKGDGMSLSGRKGIVDVYYIPRKQWHHFLAGYRGCTVLEIQWGRKVKEEDICRK